MLKMTKFKETSSMCSFNSFYGQTNAKLKRKVKEERKSWFTRKEAVKLLLEHDFTNEELAIMSDGELKYWIYEIFG